MFYITRAGVEIARNRGNVIYGASLEAVVMMSAIVGEDDTHAVIVTARHMHRVVAIRRREQDYDPRDEVVAGAEKSQEAQAGGEATEPVRGKSSGSHGRRKVGPGAASVNLSAVSARLCPPKGRSFELPIIIFSARSAPAPLLRAIVPELGVRVYSPFPHPVVNVFK